MAAEEDTAGTCNDVGGLVHPLQGDPLVYVVTVFFLVPLALIYLTG